MESEEHNSVKILYIYIYIYILIWEETCNVIKLIFLHWQFGIDINVESRLHSFKPIYVPRDEALEKGKRDAFNIGNLKGLLRNIIPS